MTLQEIFASSSILRAHIVDDAYDAIPSFSISAGVASRFVGELEEDDFDRACAAIGLEDAEEQQFVEALSDPHYVQKLFAVHDQFGAHAQILFGEYLTDRETKRHDLDPLIKLLEANGIECQKFGVAYAVETTEEPHFIFIDLRLHEDGSPISVDAAVAVCKKLRDHHQGCQPFVFLMSTLVEPLKQRREEFRLQAKLFASQFESLEKRLFVDEAELTYVLARYARVLPQLKVLQKSIEDVGSAVHTAVSRVQDELKNLDLADYFVLHRNTVSIEKVGLGTYISDLVLDYLVHEVESTAQIWNFARELDKLKPENLPRSRFAVTPAAGKIYSGTLLHAKCRLDAEQDRELGPSQGYFYLGDIFFSAEELNGPVPKTALVIATPACDLVRPEVLRKRTIFLCEGKVQLLSASSVPAGHDNLPGVIIAHPTDPTKQLLINWDKKKLHTWHAEQVDDFKKTEGCKWVRIGRLRPLYAVQLQHAITADLGRIGVQRAPNIIVPHGVEVLIKKNGKWASLDNTDAADASTAAFSESEDRSRTVFIFADTTVLRVRRKLLDWITRNLAKPEVVPKDVAQPAAEAAQSVAEVAQQPQAVPAAATDISLKEVGNAAAQQAPGLPVPMTTAAAADLLRKIMGIADFDQRLMYTEHVAPSNEDVTKTHESCAFPFLGADGLTDEESRTFAIVRPGKPSVYQSVAGGQVAKIDQVATVVLKLLKVKEIAEGPKPKPIKAPTTGNLAELPADPALAGNAVQPLASETTRCN